MSMLLSLTFLITVCSLTGTATTNTNFNITTHMWSPHIIYVTMCARLNERKQLLTMLFVEFVCVWCSRLRPINSSLSRQLGFEKQRNCWNRKKGYNIFRIFNCLFNNHLQFKVYPIRFAMWKSHAHHNTVWTSGLYYHYLYIVEVS